jgi:GxxExxY protein
MTMTLEPPRELDALANRVIGAALEVHRQLGPGFLESVYEEALAVELKLRGIRAERQEPTPVIYKSHPITEHRLDFLIERSLIVELKAVEKFLPIHRAQLISYLKAARLSLGLLINFNERWLRDGIERIVLT